MVDGPDPTESLSDLKDLLTKRVGPLPVGVWVAAAAAGVGAAVVFSRRNRPPDTETDGAAVEETDEQPVLGFTTPGFVFAGNPGGAATGQSPGPGGLNVNPPETITTNSDWQNAAVTALTARGLQPSIVHDAISRWMGGQTLNSQGVAIVDQALKILGPPPIPPPAATTPPTPAPTTSQPGNGSAAPAAPPKQAPKPAPPTNAKPAPSAPAPAPAPAGHRRGVKVGSTMYAMYRDVYGRPPNIIQIWRIAAHNGLSVGPAPQYRISPWKVGQVVLFPSVEPSAT